jgi:hypothetical protein
MKRLLLLLVIALALPAAYVYYYADDLLSFDPTKWVQNGTVTQSTGFTSSPAVGGSLISTVPVPGGLSRYEVRAKLRLAQTGGSYTMYVSVRPTPSLPTREIGSGMEG